MKLLLWLWLAQGADIATTSAALHRGCLEQTYWSGNPAAIAGGKIAGSVVISFGAHKSSAGRGIAIGFASAATVAAVLNVRTLPTCSTGASREGR